MSSIQYTSQIKQDEYQQLVAVYHSVGWMGHDLNKYYAIKMGSLRNEWEVQNDHKTCDN